MRIQNKHYILIALAMLLTAPLASWGQETIPAGVSPKILPSVAILNIQRADGKPAIGTAFLGVKDGMLVTALHIIRDAVRVTATFPNGEEFDCSGIIDKDERRNLALIRIKAFGRPMLKIDPAELAAGEKLLLSCRQGRSVRSGRNQRLGIVDQGRHQVLSPGRGDPRG